MRVSITCTPAFSRRSCTSTFSFSAKFGLGKEKVKKPFVPAPDMRNMKVLVVDDNATSRNILQDMLQSFSFDVTLAASGKDGLNEIERADKDKPFELVIMDWKSDFKQSIPRSIGENRVATQVIFSLTVSRGIRHFGREKLKDVFADIGP